VTGRSVEEIIDGLEKDVNETHQKFIQLPREDVEALVDYFRDLDKFKDSLS
jgi:hypothetical protein